MKVRIGKPVTEEETNRRPYRVVLDVVDGPSRRGSTVYKEERKCPRAAALRYIVGLRSTKPKDALDIGLIVHHAWEVYYRCIQRHQAVFPSHERASEDFWWGASQDAEHAAWAAISPIAQEPGYEEVWDTAQRALVGYFEEYRRRDAWEIVAVEETLEYSGPLFDYTVRQDLIVRRADSPGLWLVEHKTAKLLNESLQAGYAMDMQTLGQFWTAKKCLAPALAQELRGVLVNIVTKHKTPQFLRVEVVPPTEQLIAFERYLVFQTQHQLLNAQQGHPLAFGQCTGAVQYFGTCTYYDICRARPLATIEQIASEPAPFGFTIGEDDDYDDQD